MLLGLFPPPCRTRVDTTRHETRPGKGFRTRQVPINACRFVLADFELHRWNTKLGEEDERNNTFSSLTNFTAFFSFQFALVIYKPCLLALYSTSDY